MTRPPALKLSSRLSGVAPSATLALTQKANDLAAEGHDVVALTAGEPDFDPPAHVLAATKAALDAGHTRYTNVAGIEPLREAIAARYRADGLSIGAAEVVVSCGAKQAIYDALQAILEPGDRVVVVAPFWLSYADMVRLAGGEPVIVETAPEHGFELTPEALERALAGGARALILNSPSNPTGAAYTAEALRALGAVLDRHPDVLIIADEIYRRVWFGPGEAPSLPVVHPSLRDRSLIVDGVSKTYAMTGFRIGWAAGPRSLIAAMSKLQGQSTSSPAAPMQHGALAALTGDQAPVAEMVAAFDVRRRFVVSRLRAIAGIECFDPKGAFYAFPSIAGLIGRRLPDGTRIESAMELCAHLLHEHHLVVVPGAPFGAADHLRLSFATDLDTLGRGLERLQRAAQALR